MGMCVSVGEDRVAIVERFGAFERAARPGLLFLPVPCVCTVAGEVSRRVQHLDVDVETKTSDNTFVSIRAAVMFRVADPYAAFYKLGVPRAQIESLVEDVLRGCAPTRDLDGLFAEKALIADSIKDALKQDLADYGYEIVSVLVTDVRPDALVRTSMNSINAQQRLRAAQQEVAEAQKMVQIKKAEGESQASYLQGLGVARQRRAIGEWLNKSVSDFEGSSAKDVIDLLLVTQYFDTLKDIANENTTHAIFMNRKKKAIPGK